MTASNATQVAHKTSSRLQANYIVVPAPVKVFRRQICCGALRQGPGRSSMLTSTTSITAEIAPSV